MNPYISAAFIGALCALAVHLVWRSNRRWEREHCLKLDFEQYFVPPCLAAIMCVLVVLLVQYFLDLYWSPPTALGTSLVIYGLTIGIVELIRRKFFRRAS